MRVDLVNSAPKKNISDEEQTDNKSVTSDPAAPQIDAPVLWLRESAIKNLPSENSNAAVAAPIVISEATPYVRDEFWEITAKSNVIDE